MAQKHDDMGSEVPPVRVTHEKSLVSAGLIVGVLVTAAIALLIGQNRDSASFEWLFIDFTAPLWLMMTLAFVAGAVACYAGQYVVRRGRAKRAEVSRTATSNAKAPRHGKAQQAY